MPGDLKLGPAPRVADAASVPSRRPAACVPGGNPRNSTHDAKCRLRGRPAGSPRLFLTIFSNLTKPLLVNCYLASLFWPCFTIYPPAYLYLLVCLLNRQAVIATDLLVFLCRCLSFLIHCELIVGERLPFHSIHPPISEASYVALVYSSGLYCSD